MLATAFATPSEAHWADLAVAEIVTGKTQTQIKLTFPTGLVASSDDNRDGELQPDEVRTHQAELQAFLGERIRLTDSQGHRGVIAVKPSDTTALPANLKTQAGSHSSLLLVYTWSKPVQGLKIYYDLFLPGVPTARCLATIFHAGKVQNYIFSPENRQLDLIRGSLPAGSLPVALAVSFIWGAMHALSPGHGKTVIGAYLVGSRATAQHAMFLGLTTTISHTTSIFALGLVTLFASQYILPEQLYPWFSFLSGLIVVIIGLNMFINRLSSAKGLQKSPVGHSHDNEHFHSHSHHQHHHHTHEHDHHDHQHHDHTHEHDHHHHHHTHDEHEHNHTHHSHLPPGVDGEPVTWRSLLALGISGGLVPCPSALVLLLSSVALGRVGFGLVLVLAFSLGLAATLTGIGLLLVGGRRLFDRLPTPGILVRGLPALSALFITLLGLGLTTQALAEIGIVKF